MPMGKWRPREDNVDENSKWDYKQLAERRGVSVRTLMRWVAAGQVQSPKYRGQVALFDYAGICSVMEGPGLPGVHSRRASIRAKAKQDAVERSSKRGLSRRKLGGK